MRRSSLSTWPSWAVRANGRVFAVRRRPPRRCTANEPRAPSRERRDQPRRTLRAAAFALAELRDGSARPRGALGLVVGRAQRIAVVARQLRLTSRRGADAAFAKALHVTA